MLALETLSADREPISRVEAVGEDRAGIVAGLCGVLAGRGVNICELTTRSSPGPGGSPHYELRILAEVPENAEVRALREALEEVANRLVIDVAMLPV